MSGVGARRQHATSGALGGPLARDAGRVCSTFPRLVDEAAALGLWAAVWTRSQCEAKVENALRRKRLETFLPWVRVRSARRDRRVIVERPLFPGYLFVRLAACREDYLGVVATEGVVRILGNGWDDLHPIPHAQIEAVRRMVTTGPGARPLPWICAGDRVRIVAGPLAGLEGFAQQSRVGRSTFVVSVDLLQRSVGVEVAAEDLLRI